MREIKFRAWDKLNKRMNLEVVGLHWVAKGGARGGDRLDAIEGLEDTHSRCDTQNFILLQYTGLKDKNGKEIYEGDILKWGLGEDKALTTIEFFDGAFRFSGDQVVQEDECLGDYGFEQYGEVIGNIFENPELLTPNKETEEE